MIKKIFKIQGMHCTSCNFIIEDELDSLGVKAKASYQNGEVEVEFDETKVTVKSISDAMKKVGYSIQ